MWIICSGPKAEKYSRATVVQIHMVLKRALRWGEKRGKVGRNVAGMCDTPKGPRREGISLTPAEARSILTTARDNPMEALYVLALTIPTRPGELLGLPWSAINWENGEIHFRQALHRNADGTHTLGKLKTEQSRRIVAADPMVLDALRRRRDAQTVRCIAVPGSDAGTDPDLVFTSSNGRPIDFANARRNWRAVLAAAGITKPLRLYDLRVTAVSLLSAAGVPLESIADLAGHRNANVTAAVYRKQLTPVLRSARGVMQGGPDQQLGTRLGTAPRSIMAGCPMWTAHNRRSE